MDGVSGYCLLSIFCGLLRWNEVVLSAGRSIIRVFVSRTGQKQKQRGTPRARVEIGKTVLVRRGLRRNFEQTRFRRAAVVNRRFLVLWYYLKRPFQESLLARMMHVEGKYFLITCHSYITDAFAGRCRLKVVGCKVFGVNASGSNEVQQIEQKEYEASRQTLSGNMFVHLVKMKTNSSPLLKSWRCCLLMF